MIIDPDSDNYAILDDGRLGIAFRLVDVENPEAPTMAEVTAGKIIGYGEWGTA